MIAIFVSLEGDRLLISGLQRAAREVPDALKAGVFNIAQEIHRVAHGKLSGPGRKKVTRKTRARGQFDLLGGRPGSYPVPVLTGHLRRSLGLVKPGASKTSNGVVFTAGKFEAIVYDSAEYANVIHDGKRSSAKFGKRPYLTDAAKEVNAVGILERHIREAMRKHGI